MSPTYPQSGGCSCRSVRYRLAGPPLTVYACHCTDCQTLSGSAFGLSMPVSRDTFEIINGMPKAWHRVTPSGEAATVWFCGDCGVRLYSGRPTRPTRFNVRAGTLDDTSWLTPVGHIWTRSAQPWMRFGDDALAFATQPEDFQPFLDAWQRRLTGG